MSADHTHQPATPTRDVDTKPTSRDTPSALPHAHGPSGGMTGATTPSGASGGISARDLAPRASGAVKISGGVG
ncbi:hypothetical protein EDC64_101603 [Aquabacter spiritensis]|uniref:Uncharacterized protein n=1 Tax=Aquabacter spiritensis TaxID=933073 RepID=A0A4R3M662_9HYPH|nr:hypothetical protein EDC64_101603 [Aquabacter spiritensis]